MKDSPKLDVGLIVTGLSTLLIAGLSIWTASKLSPKGELPIPEHILWEAGSAIGVIYLGLISYTYQLWRRDRKRERVRFAREMGRPVCGCTTDGAVMLVDPKQSNQFEKVYVCPICRDKTVIGVCEVRVG
jgi:hypothetical protein